MKIVIEAEPKEIAALVLELQERQVLSRVRVDGLTDEIMHHLQGLQDQDSQAAAL